MESVAINLQGNVQNSAATPLYAAFPDLMRFTLGEGADLIYNGLTGGTMGCSSNAVKLLHACNSFATLEEHASNLAEKFGIPQQQIAAVRDQLDRFVDARVMVSQTELVEGIRKSAPPSCQEKISTLAIPTRNRPQYLERALSSYAECSREFGREIEFYVSDDSEDAEMRKNNRSIVESLKERLKVAVRYSGLDEKKQFAAALIQESEVPAEIVEFAILNPENCPLVFGANRNAITLANVGKLLISADDDTVCRTAPAPTQNQKLALCSKQDPTEVWFPTTDEDISQGNNFTRENIFEMHEQLLGQPVSRCITDAGADQGCGLDLNQVHGSFFRKLNEHESRILVTSLGAAGDSGMESSNSFVQMLGESRTRLMQSEETYRSVLQNHQIIRCATNKTISEGPVLMAMNVGLDNRGLLPPFMPVQRNEDGIFALLLRTTFNGAFFGYLPATILHDRPKTRTHDVTDIVKNAGRIRMGEICFMLASQNVLPGTSESRLTRLGRALEEIGDLPLAEFEEILKIALWRALSQQVATLQSQLKIYGNAPAFWHKDLTEHIAALQREGLRDNLVVPSDLLEQFGLEPARTLSKRIVQKFGMLLQAWPALRQAAVQIEKKG